MLEVSYLCISLLKIENFSKHRREMQEDKVGVGLGRAEPEGPPRPPAYVVEKGHTCRCFCW